MKTKKDIISHEHTSAGLTRLSSNIEQMAKKLLGEHGFSEVDLLKNWASVVGEDFAAYCIPERIDFKKGMRTDGTLILKVATGALALELSHKEPIIIEKINTYFGYGAVSRIKIMQTDSNLFTPHNINIADIEKKKLVTEQEENYIKTIGENVENETLKAKLQSLARSICLANKNEN